MTELQQYLKYYFEISTKDLDLLADQFKFEKLSKDDYFLSKGQLSTKLSFIKKGHLRVFDYVDGKEVTQWISSPGDFITDLGTLVFGEAARRNIQALNDCELYTLSEDRYKRLGDIIPAWQELEKLFIAKCFMTLEDRVFGFLSMTAEERFQQLFQYKRELFNEVPLQYLASMMGMSPETLSRIRKKMNS
ncbi:Crp/Fnr family transcriptional regulator [Echinicola shivajiensis]|uniref:Crp/Fnr family transcriptional regulator n=1 Tax=Echinicola shivajiensis TaxID=1035916 RepID=UPI001BFCCC3A|nr:Crp/Fnr family transcriptional regulator [Echinicola shivajiensis]